MTEADIPAGVSPELRTLMQGTISPDATRRADAAKKLGDLGQCAAPAVPFLIRLVQDEARLDVGESALEDPNDASVGSVARAAIAKIGTPAVDLLLAQMSDSVGETRFSAALALERCTDARIVMPLIGRFKDRDPGVRLLAVSHFCEHQDPRVVSPLLDMLDDRDEEVQRAAALALGEQGDRRAVLHLLKIFQRATASNRHEAAYALARIGDRAGLEALIAALNDRYEMPRFRISAAGALRNASNCGPSAVESLTRVLRDGHEVSALRGEAAQVLAKIQGTKVVPLLSEIARRPSENDRVRFWAAMSVIRVTDGAIDDLEILTPVREGYVDMQMRENLSELDDRAERTEEALAKVAKQGKTPAVRSEASRVLAEFRKLRSGEASGDGKKQAPAQ